MQSTCKLFDFKPNFIMSRRDDAPCREAFRNLTHIGSQGIEKADPKTLYQNLKKTLDCDHLTSEDFRRVRKDLSQIIHFDIHKQTYGFLCTAYPMTFAYLEYHARQLLND